MDLDDVRDIERVDPGLAVLQLVQFAAAAHFRTLDDGLGQELVHPVGIGQFDNQRGRLCRKRRHDGQEGPETLEVQHFLRKRAPDVAATQRDDRCRVLHGEVNGRTDAVEDLRVNGRVLDQQVSNPLGQLDAQIVFQVHREHHRRRRRDRWNPQVLPGFSGHECVLDFVVNAAVQQRQDERLHLVVIVAAHVEANRDRIEELAPVAAVVLDEAFVGFRLAPGDGRNARFIERFHPGNRAPCRRRYDQVLAQRVVAIFEVTRQVATIDQLLLARHVAVAVEQVEHRARHEDLHLGPCLHAPQLRDLDLRADQVANEGIGEIEIRLCGLPDAELLLHVQELGTVAQAALVALGVQRQHALDLGPARAQQQDVAAQRPVQVVAALGRVRFDHAVVGCMQSEHVEHRARERRRSQFRDDADVGAVDEEKIRRYDRELRDRIECLDPVEHTAGQAEPFRVAFTEFVLDALHGERRLETHELADGAVEHIAQRAQVTEPREEAVVRHEVGELDPRNRRCTVR